MKKYITPKSVAVRIDSEELLEVVSRQDIFLEIADEQTFADPTAEILGKGTSGWDSWE